MDFYRRKYTSHYTPEERWTRRLELVKKCSTMLALPIPFPVAACAFWYYAIYKHSINFDAHMETITTAAWIPTFGILYSLLVAVVLNTVWTEMKAMRSAVKRYDLETFIELRDEEISPLIYCLMTVLSLKVLGGFMSLKFPSICSGLILISSTSYLLGLIFWVVWEIDDPCGGFWVIKSIPPEWLAIDVRAWRKYKHEKLRVKAMKEIREFEESMAAAKTALAAKVTQPTTLAAHF